MKAEQMKKGWQEKSEEVNQGMLEWRQAHLRASFREIEAEVDRRLDEFRAQMLSDTANVSASAEWIEGPDGPVCPHCGVRLEGKGRKKRRLQVRGGNEVEIEREYGKCPECGQGIFPPG
jgi:DNA-directed RNA polymerase subunit RPC12/RpoP